MKRVVDIDDFTFEQCVNASLTEGTEGVPFHAMKAIANSIPADGKAIEEILKTKPNELNGMKLHRTIIFPKTTAEEYQEAKKQYLKEFHEKFDGEFNEGIRLLNKVVKIESLMNIMLAITSISWLCLFINHLSKNALPFGGAIALFIVFGLTYPLAAVLILMYSDSESKGRGLIRKVSEARGNYGLDRIYTGNRGYDCPLKEEIECYTRRWSWDLMQQDSVLNDIEKLKENLSDGVYTYENPHYREYDKTVIFDICRYGYPVEKKFSPFWLRCDSLEDFDSIVAKGDQGIWDLSYLDKYALIVTPDKVKKDEP